MFRPPGTNQEEGTIPQAILPLIPDGATRITELVSVVRQDGRWTYFIGVQAMFAHDENDHRSFQMYAASPARVEQVNVFG